MLFRKKTNKNKFQFKFSTEMLAVSADDTAQTALELIRSSNLAGNIFYCYVTDKEGKLAGVVPLRKLITAHKETKISDIMLRNPIRLTADSSADTALEFFLLYKFIAFPVVDEHGKLVGIARANDFLEDTMALEEKTEHERDDLLKMIGIQLDEFRKPTILKSTFLRFPYLLFNISSGLICAFITRLFDRTIDEFIFVAFFITIILGLAESIGTQAVAVTLSQLEKTIKLKRLVLYEVLVGAKIGLLCGGVLYAVSFFWIGNQSFSITLSLTILLTLFTASFLGCSLPILFKKVGINPAHASCPLVLAIADIVSLTSYFSLGTYMLK
ncbi:MAG: magnesium transporter [Candidatus Kuenenia stuttgartiensis]|nr:magnesium transporter [Candidatus Kuenenia stuttgartiensis]